MVASPFHKIIFPAILASSSLFTALTLPIASLGTGPVAISLPAPLTQWQASLFPPEQKELSIRYIGFSITASVAAGVGTAEIIRKQQNRRQRQHDLMQLLDDSTAPEATATFQKDLFTVNEVTPLARPSGIDWQAHPEAPISSWSTAETSPETFAETPTTPALASLSASFALSQLNPLSKADIASSSPVVNQSLRKNMVRFQALSLQTLDEVNQHTCRIQIQGNPERLLALQIEGKFYRFFRVRSSLDQALAVVATSKKRGENAIATPHSRGYAVWIYQPNAQLEDDQWQDLRLIA